MDNCTLRAPVSANQITVISMQTMLESRIKKYNEASTDFFKGMFNNDVKKEPEPQTNFSNKEFEEELQKAVADFLKDETEKKLHLPAKLTATEEMYVKEHAQQMGLRVRESKQAGPKCLFLEKDDK